MENVDPRYTRIKEIIADRNEAISQARFWRALFLYTFAALMFGGGVSIAEMLGWI